MPKKLYSVPSTCHVCSRKFMARYNVGTRAKVCTSHDHVCKKGEKSGKKTSCITSCCRSKYSSSSADMDNAIDPKKVLSDPEFKSVVAETRKIQDLISITLRFIAATGCRLGEALLVTAGGITIRPGKLSIVKTPTLKRGGRPIRSVYIKSDHPIIAELRALIAKRKPGDLIFQVSRRSLQRRMEEILAIYKPKRSGLVHIFRHTRASQLIQAGADWQTVRQQLGWASLEMAKRYVHTNEDLVAKVLEKI